MSVDPINVYLFSTVLSYHFKSSRKSCFFNRCSDEFGQKAKNVRGPHKCIPIFDCFELKIFQFIFGFPERAFFLAQVIFVFELLLWFDAEKFVRLYPAINTAPHMGGSLT